MPEVKVNLDKKTDKKIKLYMIQHDFGSKEKAIIDIIKKKLR